MSAGRKIRKIPEQLKLLPIDQIKPPHSAEMHKASWIAKQIKTNGWKGRPLLVLKLKSQQYRALTGSHRYAAVKKLKLKQIPCMVIESKKMKLVLERWDRYQTYSTYRIFNRILKEEGLYLASILMSKDYT